MAVTTNILQRTFHIHCNGSTGTCFTVDIDKRRYLVTARHIVDSIGVNGEIMIFHKNNWKLVNLQLIGHGKENADVSVFAPRPLFGKEYDLSVTIEGLALSEDVYFLGFPFGIGQHVGRFNDYFPLPVLKKATVSSLRAFSQDHLILLDGHSNPGFSGGPVVRSINPTQVVGVVTGSLIRKENVSIYDSSKSPLSYDQDTGIMCVHTSKHILDIVSDNPVGTEITENNEITNALDLSD